MHVSELWIYPIKSCRGIAVEELTLDDRGPVHDRRWMLVDERNRFLTQREFPRLTLVDVALAGDALRLGAPAVGELLIAPPESAEARCVIWKDTVALQPAAPEAHAWFSEYLGANVRLMHMARSSHRVIDRVFSPEARLVTLADGYPLLLIGEGSLALLNEKLVERGEEAVSMQRFRPNIVVHGTAPHAEDAWRRIRIGELTCDVVKPCARCPIPTVDLETGIMGKEPNRTLATYRRLNGKVYFGQNLIHAFPGVLTRGASTMLL